MKSRFVISDRFKQEADRLKGVEVGLCTLVHFGFLNDWDSIIRKELRNGQTNYAHLCPMV